MPKIVETIITTISASGVPHIAPLGLIETGEGWIIAPFHPSKTLLNLRENPNVIANYTDDVRIFAGCLTGRGEWPLLQTTFGVPRLANCLAHAELSVSHIEDHEERPRFHCRTSAYFQHGAFQGLSRAKSAVLELAILASRLDRLPADQVQTEISYLENALQKTGGPEELEAWGWLMDKIINFYSSKVRA